MRYTNRRCAHTAQAASSVQPPHVGRSTRHRGLVGSVQPSRRCPANRACGCVRARSSPEPALRNASRPEADGKNACASRQLRSVLDRIRQVIGFTSRSFALKPSRSIVATSLSDEVFASSNSTRAWAFSKLTSTFFTPGSLSKAAATEAWQELQTIPFTSMVATLAAACAVMPDAKKARTTRGAIRKHASRIDVLPSHAYMPAAM